VFNQADQGQASKKLPSALFRKTLEPFPVCYRNFGMCVSVVMEVVYYYCVKRSKEVAKQGWWVKESLKVQEELLLF